MSKPEPTYLLMQATEMEVFHAASRIYSAMIQTNSVPEADKAQAMKTAVQDAVKLAELADEMVTAPDEHVDGRRTSRRSMGLYNT